MTNVSPPRRVVVEGGIELHLIDRGAGEPVLLLHGGLGDCNSWAPQLAAISQQRRAIAFSRRHHSPNRNPVAAGHAIDDDVHDLRLLQHHLGTGPAHLVGTSYGALVALLYAMRYPDAVLSLALAEPPLHRWACRSAEGQALYSAFTTEVWRASASAFDRGEDALALQLLVDGIAGHPVFETLPPNRVAAAWRNAGAMRALTRSADPFPDLSRAAVAALAMPVLLIRGENCSGLHLCVMNELAQVLPGAMQAVIRDAGHGSPLENPAAFNACILSLMDRVPAAQALANRPLSSAGRYLPLQVGIQSGFNRTEEIP